MKQIIVSSHFVKFKKRAHSKLQLTIDEQVKLIIENPEIGELKKGDLKTVRILKFKFNKQLYLLSYEFKMETLFLYTIGSHENYYRDLKNYLH